MYPFRFPFSFVRLLPWLAAFLLSIEVEATTQLILPQEESTVSLEEVNKVSQQFKVAYSDYRFSFFHPDLRNLDNTTHTDISSWFIKNKLPYNHTCLKGSSAEEILRVLVVHWGQGTLWKKCFDAVYYLESELLSQIYGENRTQNMPVWKCVADTLAQTIDHPSISEHLFQEMMKRNILLVIGNYTFWVKNKIIYQPILRWMKEMASRKTCTFLLGMHEGEVKSFPFKSFNMFHAQGVTRMGEWDLLQRHCRPYLLKKYPQRSLAILRKLFTIYIKHPMWREWAQKYIKYVRVFSFVAAQVIDKGKFPLASPHYIPLRKNRALKNTTFIFSSLERTPTLSDLGYMTRTDVLTILVENTFAEYHRSLGKHWNKRYLILIYYKPAVLFLGYLSFLAEKNDETYISSYLQEEARRFIQKTWKKEKNRGDQKTENGLPVGWDGPIPAFLLGYKHECPYAHKVWFRTREDQKYWAALFFVRQISHPKNNSSLVVPFFKEKKYDLGKRDIWSYALGICTQRWRNGEPGSELSLDAFWRIWASQPRELGNVLHGAATCAHLEEAGGTLHFGKQQEKYEKILESALVPFFEVLKKEKKEDKMDIISQYSVLTRCVHVVRSVLFTSKILSVLEYYHHATKNNTTCLVMLRYLEFISRLPIRKQVAREIHLLLTKRFLFSAKKEQRKKEENLKQLIYEGLEAQGFVHDKTFTPFLGDMQKLVGQDIEWFMHRLDYLFLLFLQRKDDARLWFIDLLKCFAVVKKEKKRMKSFFDFFQLFIHVYPDFIEKELFESYRKIIEHIMRHGDPFSIQKLNALFLLKGEERRLNQPNGFVHYLIGKISSDNYKSSPEADAILLGLAIEKHPELIRLQALKLIRKNTLLFLNNQPGQKGFTTWCHICYTLSSFVYEEKKRKDFSSLDEEEAWLGTILVILPMIPFEGHEGYVTLLLNTFLKASKPSTVRLFLRKISSLYPEYIGQVMNYFLPFLHRLFSKYPMLLLDALERKEDRELKEKEFIYAPSMRSYSSMHSLASLDGSSIHEKAFPFLAYMLEEADSPKLYGQVIRFIGDTYLLIQTNKKKRLNIGRRAIALLSHCDQGYLEKHHLEGVCLEAYIKLMSALEMETGIFMNIKIWLNSNKNKPNGGSKEKMWEYHVKEETERLFALLYTLNPSKEEEEEAEKIWEAIGPYVAPSQMGQSKTPKTDEKLLSLMKKAPIELEPQMELQYYINPSVRKPALLKKEELIPLLKKHVWHYLENYVEQRDEKSKKARLKEASLTCALSRWEALFGVTVFLLQTNTSGRKLTNMLQKQVLLLSEDVLKLSWSFDQHERLLENVLDAYVYLFHYYARYKNNLFIGIATKWIRLQEKLYKAEPEQAKWQQVMVRGYNHFLVACKRYLSLDLLQRDRNRSSVEEMAKKMMKQWVEFIQSKKITIQARHTFLSIVRGLLTMYPDFLEEIKPLFSIWEKTAQGQYEVCRLLIYCCGEYTQGDKIQSKASAAMLDLLHIQAGKIQTSEAMEELLGLLVLLAHRKGLEDLKESIGKLFTSLHNTFSQSDEWGTPLVSLDRWQKYEARYLAGQMTKTYLTEERFEQKNMNLLTYMLMFCGQEEAKSNLEKVALFKKKEVVLKFKSLVCRLIQMSDHPLLLKFLVDLSHKHKILDREQIVNILKEKPYLPLKKEENIVEQYKNDHFLQHILKEEVEKIDSVELWKKVFIHGPLYLDTWLLHEIVNAVNQTDHLLDNPFMQTYHFFDCKHVNIEVVVSVDLRMKAIYTFLMKYRLPVRVDGKLWEKYPKMVEMLKKAAKKEGHDISSPFSPWLAKNKTPDNVYLVPHSKLARMYDSSSSIRVSKQLRSMHSLFSRALLSSSFTEKEEHEDFSSDEDPEAKRKQLKKALKQLIEKSTSHTLTGKDIAVDVTLEHNMWCCTFTSCADKAKIALLTAIYQQDSPYASCIKGCRFSLEEKTTILLLGYKEVEEAIFLKEQKDRYSMLNTQHLSSQMLRSSFTNDLPVIQDNEEEEYEEKRQEE